MLIYLDTVLWNRLYDENVSPPEIIGRLAAKQSSIAVSPFVFYELLKTFSNPTNFERGTKLLAYFAEFVKRTRFVVADNFLMLPEEVRSLQTGKTVDPFSALNDNAEFRTLVNRLANGGFSHYDREQLIIQQGIANRCRHSAVDLLARTPGAADRLQSISSAELPQFLRKESMTPEGVFFLRAPLRDAFANLSRAEIDSIARGLLTPPAKRFARGGARAGIYYQWRQANFGSVPKDVAEDMTHILNSVYCDVYATSEAKQADYAHLLVTSHTRIALSSDAGPIDEWIVGLAGAVTA